MKCHEVGWVGLEMKKEMKKKRVRRFAFVVSCRRERQWSWFWL
jgi:hypothetical protein